MVKEFWQKAASSSCHRLRWRIDSSDLDPYLIHSSLAHPNESVPQTASRSVQPFYKAHERDQDPHTDTQADHATPSIAIARILCNACDVA